MVTNIYLADPDRRVLLVPCEPQPGHDEEILYDNEADQWCVLKAHGGGFFINAPISVGERVPVREEWRIVRYNWADEGKTTATIEYRDGSQSYAKVCVILSAREGNVWQPAETMPDFAVRHWRRVTKMIAVEIIGGEPGREYGGWHWQIEVEPEDQTVTDPDGYMEGQV